MDKRQNPWRRLRGTTPMWGAIVNEQMGPLLYTFQRPLQKRSRFGRDKHRVGVDVRRLTRWPGEPGRPQAPDYVIDWDDPPDEESKPAKV